MSSQTIERLDGVRQEAVKENVTTAVSNVSGFIPKESLKKFNSSNSSLQLVTTKTENGKKPIDLTCVARFAIPFEDTVDAGRDGKSEVWTTMDLMKLLHN